MADKLRFGIVGCGVIGPVHAEAIASLPDAQLVSLCIHPHQNETAIILYKPINAIPSSQVDSPS